MWPILEPPPPQLLCTVSIQKQPHSYICDSSINTTAPHSYRDRRWLILQYMLHAFYIKMIKMHQVESRSLILFWHLDVPTYVLTGYDLYDIWPVGKHILTCPECVVQGVSCVVAIFLLKGLHTTYKWTQTWYQKTCSINTYHRPWCIAHICSLEWRFLSYEAKMHVYYSCSNFLPLGMMYIHNQCKSC